MKNVPNVLEIKDIIYETPTIKTFIFDWLMIKDNIPKPGQFVMIWNFKDEKPMSISTIDLNKNEIGITVKRVGSFTEDLHKLNIGDKLGIRGPYGNGFNIDNVNNMKILAIGGGVGMAPVSSFIESLDNNKNVDLVCAALNKDELLFKKKLKEKGVNIFTSTDDGSCGYKGYAYHRTMDLIKSNSYDMAIVCGPEIMMIGIFDLLRDNNINAQYSLERYMKCAIGICGQCCVDNTGWRVCVEGPVFSSKDLKEIKEFGKYHRNSCGIKEFY